MGQTTRLSKKDASIYPVETMDNHVFHYEVWIDLDVEESTLHSYEGRTLKVPQIVLYFSPTSPWKILGFQAPNQVCFVIAILVALAS